MKKKEETKKTLQKKNNLRGATVSKKPIRNQPSKHVQVNTSKDKSASMKIDKEKNEEKSSSSIQHDDNSEKESVKKQVPDEI